MKYVPAGLLWITVTAMPVSFPAYAQDAQANGVTAALSLTAEFSSYSRRRGSDKTRS